MRHHHVNLGVPAGGLAGQREFLVDVLGYQRVEPPAVLQERGIGVHWFEGSDGAQIHLSEDPEHRAADKAHVAIECDSDELDRIEDRLRALGRAYTSREATDGFPRFVSVRDPAGNLWELRGPM